jgi:glucokinase
VSGPGLARIFSFLLDTGRAAPSERTRAILALPAADRPAAIGAGGDPACERALDLFVDLYARVCAELCAVFLPTGGLFLAVGIALRHGARFQARFMTVFENNYLEHLNGINRAIPVHIVRDYAISLYGAAHAACLPEP